MIEEIKHKDNEKLCYYSTFRIGGAAKRIFMPKDASELSLLVNYCKENGERYLVIGNGSNLLFSDEGFDGYIIKTNDMNSVYVDENRIYASAGAMLSKVSSVAKDNGLKGMEFAAGIPGTIGGAIVMNAGAYGGEMKDIVEYVDILEFGSIKRYLCEDMEFAYRKSIVDEDKIVIGVGLKLEKGDVALIEQKMQELKEARVSKQPLEYPSAGSTFKRPEGYFAAKLIDDCGLRGYRIGGAMVSDKHCGFVINYDNATSKDVIALINDVKKIVNDKFGVVLEPEVKIIL